MRTAKLSLPGVIPARLTDDGVPKEEVTPGVRSIVTKEQQSVRVLLY